MKLKQSHALILFFILLAFYLYFYKYNNILEKMTNINNCDKCEFECECKNKAVSDEFNGYRFKKMDTLKYSKLNAVGSFPLTKISHNSMQTTGLYTDLYTGISTGLYTNKNKR